MQCRTYKMYYMYMYRCKIVKRQKCPIYLRNCDLAPMDLCSSRLPVLSGWRFWSVCLSV